MVCSVQKVAETQKVFTLLNLFKPYEDTPRTNLIRQSHLYQSHCVGFTGRKQYLFKCKLWLHRCEHRSE